MSRKFQQPPRGRTATPAPSRPGPASRGEPLQLKSGCACGGGCPRCKAKADEAMKLQRKPTGKGEAAAPAPLNLAASGGTPMPAGIRDRAEAVFGTDLGAVRFHDDREAHASAQRLEARAFTTGQDVYFGSGWYQPHSTPGLELIGHELTHVVQQRKGLSSAKLRGAGDDYEQEADRGGLSFARGEPVQVAASGGSGQGIQRSADPGADAEIGASEDSPHGFPFLGMANTYDELVALMAELSAEEGAPLGLVTEEFAMGGGEEAPAAVAAAPGAADGVVQASLRSDAEALVQASLLSDRPIQRAVVAGCNVPGVPANIIGMEAHMQIGATCAGTAPVCLGGGHPGFQIPGAGRPDMVRRHIPAIDEVAEIKPASWLGLGLEALAAAQLATDLASYNAIIGPAVPMWSYRFPGAPFVLNPSQQLRAWGPSGGLYFYSCTGGRRRRVRIRVRITMPVPVTAPSPAPRTSPAPVTDPITIPTPSREHLETAAQVGVGIGVGYLIYRGVRMIPSLFPPLWPTIPANAAIP